MHIGTVASQHTSTPPDIITSVRLAEPAQSHRTVLTNNCAGGEPIVCLCPETTEPYGIRLSLQAAPQSGTAGLSSSDVDLDRRFSRLLLLLLFISFFLSSRDCTIHSSIHPPFTPHIDTLTPRVDLAYSLAQVRHSRSPGAPRPGEESH